MGWDPLTPLIGWMNPDQAHAVLWDNPAKLYGLYPKKGALAVGSDADFAIIDINKEQAVTVENSHSAQDHSPFAGKSLKGWPVATVLRGRLAFKDGASVGERRGAFVARPVS